jgi:hypothetical protein
LGSGIAASKVRIHTKRNQQSLDRWALHGKNRRKAAPNQAFANKLQAPSGLRADGTFPGAFDAA